MPKNTNTRRDRAAALLARLERGPQLSHIVPEDPDAAAIAWFMQSYRGWVESWILEEIKALVPELRPPRPAAR